MIPLPATVTKEVAVRTADADSLARTLAWSALWEMTRNAELPARRFIEVVSRAIGALAAAHADIGTALTDQLAH